MPQVEATQPAVPQVDATQPAVPTPAPKPTPTPAPTEAPSAAPYKPRKERTSAGPGLNLKLVAGVVGAIVVVALIAVFALGRGGGDVPAQTVTLQIQPWARITALADDSGAAVDFGDASYTPLRLELPPGTYSATFENESFAEPLEVTFKVDTDPVDKVFSFPTWNFDADTYFREAGLTP